jgi:ABC-type dipeptide/oligopeptide/nickel transport system permease component
VGHRHHGDFGFSFFANRPVVTMIGERLGWTVVVAFVTLGFSWLVAVPLGIYTALKRNGFTDAIASFVGYVGLAVPTSWWRCCSSRWCSPTAGPTSAACSARASSASPGAGRSSSTS